MKGAIRNWTDSVHLSSLVESRSKREIERTIKDNQKAIVKNILSILISLSLVRKENVSYRVHQDEFYRTLNLVFWKEANRISNSEFFDSLESSYLKFAQSPGKLVSIPVIRDEVCLRLDIPWYIFDKKLVEIGYTYNAHRISLSRPIFSKKWGVFIGKTNYYYISILEGE
jgi:hypothetical protein